MLAKKRDLDDITYPTTTTLQAYCEEHRTLNNTPWKLASVIREHAYDNYPMGKIRVELTRGIIDAINALAKNNTTQRDRIILDTLDIYLHDTPFYHRLNDKQYRLKDVIEPPHSQPHTNYAGSIVKYDDTFAIIVDDRPNDRGNIRIMVRRNNRPLVKTVPITTPRPRYVACAARRDGKKPLSVREWECPGCGSYLHRDYNAATNILLYALEAGGHSDSLNACGGNVRLRLAGAVSSEAGTHRSHRKTGAVGIPVL